MAHSSFTQFKKILSKRIDIGVKSGKPNPKYYTIDGNRKLAKELRRIRRMQGIARKELRNVNR